MANMRILMVCRSLPFHQVGGLEAVVWDLARALAKDGNIITLMTTCIPEKPLRFMEEGVQIHCLENTVPGRYSQVFWRNSVQVFKKSYYGNIQIVLGCGGGSLSIARWATSIHNPPIIIEQMHGTPWDEFLSHWRTKSWLNRAKSLKQIITLFQNLQYRKCNHIIAVGFAVKLSLENLPMKAFIRNVPVSLIPNGIDEAAFAFDEKERLKGREELGVHTGEKIIVSASRLHIQKGIAESLQAIALVKKKFPSLHFVILGEGPDEAKLKSMVKALNLTNIHFMGPRNRSEIKKYFSASDLFLLTSIRIEAGVPMGVLEALASGLPCIVSNHLLHPGITARGVNPQAPQDIAYKIISEIEGDGNDRHSKLPNSECLTFTTDRYLQTFRDLVKSPLPSV